MKGILLQLLFLAICLLSLVQLGPIESDSVSEEVDHESKRRRVDSPSETTPSSVPKVPDTMKLKCGHSHPAKDIHDSFASSTEDVKCPTCGETINYINFLNVLIVSNSIPDGITLIPERILIKAAVEIFKRLLHYDEPKRIHLKAQFLRNMFTLKFPFDKFTTEKGFTALTMACYWGTPELIDIMIENGFDFSPNGIENNINGIFHNLIKQGNDINASHLIKLGAHLDSTHPVTFRTPLQEAVISNQPKCVSLLIKKRAKIDIQTSKVEAPLILAIKSNNARIVEMLVKAGSNVTILDFAKKSAILIAIDNNYTDVLSVMLVNSDKCANFYNQGVNILHYAIINDKLPSVKTMISHGFSNKLRDGTPSYMLHRLIKLDNLEMFRYLLKNGASLYEPFDRFTYETTPVHQYLFKVNDPPIVSAIILGKIDFLEELLAAGVDPNTRINDNTTTPLLLACGFMNKDIIRMLLRYGADPNSPDKKGAVAANFVIYNEIMAEGYANEDIFSL